MPRNRTGRKKEQLVSSDQAKPSARQHRKPCSDCPWARTALPGWLGDISPEFWLRVAHGEGTADCHVTTNQQCAGLAIYRANVCKLPRNQRALRLPADRKLVFASMAEFLNHHRNEDPE